MNGAAVDLASVVSDGYALIDREWTSGDVVRLDLEMTVERARAHPDVREDVGRVALTRGPLVYCLEGVDNAAPLHRIRLAPDAKLDARFAADLLGGMVHLEGEAEAESAADWGGALYRTEPAATESTPVKAVPYFAWDNRAPGEMDVWLREG